MITITIGNLKKYVIMFIIGYIIADFVHGLTGLIIVQPALIKISNLINPPPPPTSSLLIEPISYPVEYDGKQWIRLNLENNGTAKLEDIFLDYRIACKTNETKRAYLQHTPSLNPSEKDYIDIEADLNTSCSLATQPVKMEIYVDKNKKCYEKFVSTVSNMCVYCQVDMNISARNFFLNYTYWYPYFEGDLSINVTQAKSPFNCLPYERADNKSELVHVPKYDISFWIMDIATGCIRGDFDLDWCRKNGYIR